MTRTKTIKSSLLAFLGPALLLLTGCAIPFTVTSEEKTVEVEQTAGFYVETEVNIPSEARRDGVSFDEVRLDYTVRRPEDFEATVALYADNEEDADGDQSEAEKLLEVHLDAGEPSESGSATSAKIRQALNDELRRFSVGAENAAGSLLDGTVYVDIKLTLEGEYDRF